MTVRDPPAAAPLRGRLFRILILVVLALSFLLRSSALDRLQLQGDQAEVLSQALDALEGRYLPSHSAPSSVGITEQPLEVWFAMPAVALTPDIDVAPATATLVWVSLDIVVVALLYRLGRVGAGPLTGIVAAAGYGSSFWATLFSRRMQGDNLMPLFALLSLAGWWRVSRGSSWSLIPAALATALLFETHFGAIFLLPLPILGLVLGLRNLRPVPIALACIASLLPWLPYVAWQASQGFVEVEALRSLTSAPALLDATGLRQLEQLTLASHGMPFLGPPVGSVFMEPEWALWFKRVWHAWLAVGLVLLVLRLTRPLTRWPFPRPTLTLWLLAVVATFSPGLLLVRHSFTVYIHYILGSLPAAYLLVGLTCDAVVRSLALLPRPALRLLTGSLLVSAVVVPVLYQGITVMRFYEWQRHAVTPFHNLPFGLWGELMNSAEAASQGTGGPVFAFTTDNLAEQLPYLARGRFSLRVIQPNAIVVPERGAYTALGTAEGVLSSTYIRAHEGFPYPDSYSGPYGSLAATYLRDYQGFQRLPWPGAREAAWIARLDDEDAQRLRGRITKAPMPWQVEDLLEFGTALTDEPFAPGKTTHVLVHWRTLGTPSPSADFGFFAHLVGQDRVSRSGLTASPAPVAHWQAGEVGVASFTVAIPLGLEPGRYYLAVGLYDPATSARLPLTSTTQRVEADRAVYLGPLKVPAPAPASLPLPAALQPEAVFERKIALVGASLTGNELRLQWRAGSTIGEDLTRFVHLVDNEGRLLWQSDGYPRDGTYPTSIWDGGEVIEEVLHFPSRDGLNGSWRLIIGWYRQPGVERLGVTAGPAGQPPDRLEVPIAGLSASP